MTEALNWIDIGHRPLATGRYIVAHRGHAEIKHFMPIGLTHTTAETY